MAQKINVNVAGIQRFFGEHQNDAFAEEIFFIESKLGGANFIKVQLNIG